jgi:hypothetical protein
VESFLIKTLIGARSSLSANPQGVAAVEETLARLVQSPSQASPASFPETAWLVSEHEYTCAENAASVSSLRLEFGDAGEASLSLTQYGVESVWPVGLDGKYRLSSQGQAQRGYWENPRTFVLEIFDIGQLTRRLNFTGDRLEVEVPEVGLTLLCQVQNP